MLSLSDLIRLTKDHSIETMAIVLIIGVIYLYAKGYIDFYMFKKREKYLELGKPTEMDFEESMKDIEEGEFFRNLKFKVHIDLPVETFSTDPVLNELYRDLTICLFSSYGDKMKLLLQDLNFTDNRDQWANFFLDTVYETMKDFERRVEDKNIPTKALEEFQIWFAPFLQQTYHYITLVDAHMGTDRIQKTKSFLLLLELVLVNALAQLQKFDVIDDKLVGMEYRGGVVGSQKLTD